MPQFPKQKLAAFIEQNITSFHARRLDKLLELELKDVLKRKNPYLFKAKALEIAQDLVKSILDAHLSSQEEGIFGEFLEQLARYICEQVYNGRKSSSPGIDLEFVKDNVLYVVSIKSGPNWGNSQQIERMKDNFARARRTLATNQNKIKVVAVDGCCYGKDDNFDKGDYIKYCGQRFWEFISGDEDLYLDFIEPLEKQAGKANAAFLIEYAKVINKFTISFGKEFCRKDGSIIWNKLTKYNSGKTEKK